MLLIRHALTEATGKRLSGRTPGIHLSDEGRRQAGRLAERLASLPLAALYASPLERCKETAEVIATSRGMVIREVPELTEVDYGRWTGRSMPQLVRTVLWRKVQQIPSAVTFPEGEGLIDAQRRSVAALEEIAGRHPRAAVAIVSHADVIRLVLAHYAGLHIDLFQRLIVSPASVSVIGLGDRVPRIIRMNDTGILDDLARRKAPPDGRGPPSSKKRPSAGPKGT
ncbi:MAG TPA: MSMEG_4193 family putative phosphomutase [Actinomycetota bacterium]|nr:MSMEG_4193 family putative phosphomutase [Actinomycetota bacterium]